MNSTTLDRPSTREEKNTKASALTPHILEVRDKLVFPRQRLLPDTRLCRFWMQKGYMQMLLDVVTVSSIFLIVYYFFFKWPGSVRDAGPAPDIIAYIESFLLLSLFWVFLIWREKGYEETITGSETLLHKMQIVVVSGMYALGLWIIISFMTKTITQAPLIYPVAGSMIVVVMYLTRLLFRNIELDMAEKGMVAHRILMAGLKRKSAEFAHLLTNRPTLCSVVGFVTFDSNEDPPDSFEGFPVLGHLKDIENIQEHFYFDKVLIPNSKEELEGDFIEVLNYCESKNISLYTLPNHFQVAVDQKEVISFLGMPMILMRDATARNIYPVVKRFMDIMMASAGLVLGLPVWLAIALAIKLYDGGPVFFVQTRAGLHGRPFRMYKFRSMIVKAEEKLSDLVNLNDLEEPVFKIKKDPRITPLGRFLRKTGLDEIPQLLNVLKGEMSLVGPRPEEKVVVERYNPWQRRRLKAVPGLTGYQQIHNRGEPSLANRVEYDLIYLKHQSLLLDLYILVKTIKVVCLGNGITH